jgi:hypothetical protein
MCETQSEEKHRLRMLGNKVLQRIFRPKRNERTGVQTWVYNEELHDLYKQNKLRGLNQRANYTDEQTPLVGEV